jgi:hypothetical protein
MSLRADTLRDRAHYYLSCALAYESGPYVSALHRMLYLRRAERLRRALRLAEHWARKIELEEP